MITNVMERLIDFTRTSGGGYFGPDGLFRFTPASRNLLTYTQEFDNAAWSKTRASALPFNPGLATYGSELVTNGDFSSTASWTLTATAPATATIAGGKLTLFSPAGGTANAAQAVLTVGKWYKVSGSVTVRSGTVKIICGGPLDYYFTSTKSFTIYAQAVSGASFLLSRQGACDADFDNISVREVIGGLITAPDGTLTADALIEDVSASNTHFTTQNTSISAGVSYAFSVYAKPAGRNWLGLQIGAAVMGSARTAYFNIATGTVGTVSSGITAGISPAGDGWYRCTVFFTATATAVAGPAVLLADADNSPSYTGDGASGIYLWGAQLELGSTPTDYTRNFGGVYPPRFDYDPVTLAPRGLLVEEQRTNLLLRSEEFENAAWTKLNVTVTENAGMSPDGTADADTLTASSANATLRQAVSTSAVAMTFSIYMKRKTGSGDIQISSNGTDWVTQTIDSSAWTRCIITQTALAGSTSPGVRLVTSGDQVEVWGAQYE